MKKLILDTDIGGDCDDAGACVVLKTLARNGAVDILGVTSCTTRPGAKHCIYQIFKYYGMNVDIGEMRGDSFLENDDTYAKIILNEYPEKPPAKEAVSFLREKLALSKCKVTIAAIGPQRNLQNLLKSGPCEYSDKSGAELVAEKVEELVVMGGCFANAEKKIYYQKSGEITTEWNIAQDIEAARYVNKNWNTPVVYSPFELGHEIITGHELPKGSPAHRCYEATYKLRESWDPCAVYYAAKGTDGLFKLSPYGAVTIDKGGLTRFKEGKGKRRILSAAVPDSVIAEKLNRMMS